MHKKENRGTYKKELKCNMGHSERSKIHDAQTKRSKSEKERQILYHITYMWNLKIIQITFAKQKQTHT